MRKLLLIVLLWSMNIAASSDRSHARGGECGSPIKTAALLLSALYGGVLTYGTEGLLFASSCACATASGCILARDICHLCYPRSTDTQELENRVWAASLGLCMVHLWSNKLLEISTSPREMLFPCSLCMVGVGHCCCEVYKVGRQIFSTKKQAVTAPIMSRKDKNDE